MTLMRPGYDSAKRSATIEGGRLTNPEKCNEVQCEGFSVKGSVSYGARSQQQDGENYSQVHIVIISQCVYVCECESRTSTMLIGCLCVNVSRVH